MKLSTTNGVKIKELGEVKMAYKEGIKRQLNAMHTVSMVLVYLMTL